MKHSSTILLALLLSGSRLSATPVINELFYHPQQPGPQLNPTGPEDLTKEWLEIYNPDTVSVDLTGYTIGGGSVAFTFPSYVLTGGSYVVVAANAAAFHSAHLSVTNYLGNWAGELGNVDDSVDLIDPAGVKVDHVHYDTEGDWAKMRNITTLDSLGYPYGWLWQSEHDGGGKSLELVNPNLKHNNGQNWLSSTPAGGTPGLANSTAAVDVAPLIENVEHFPKVPTHLNLITVKAQLLDELTTGVTGKVYYRIPVTGAVQPAWTAVAMHDDGLTGDDIANDGFFAATLPAQALGALVEYYVESKDAASRLRTWPTASDDTGNHNANALYQVDEEVTASTAPLYRILMTPNELAVLDAEAFSSGNRTSQRYLCAFMSLADGSYTERQRCTTRIRGAGSRGSHPRSVRVDFLNAQPWQGNVSVNLNTQYTYLQFIGAQLAHAAGIVCADAKPVQVRFNATNRMSQAAQTGSEWARNYGMATHVEPINRDFIKHHYPNDASGNLYTKRGTTSVEWQVASSLAAAPAFYAGAGTSGTGEGWEKQNNSSAMNYADLFNFTSAMTANYNAPTAAYLTNVGAIMDVNQWLRSIAVSTILTNGETNLLNGRDDDYSMYAGVVNPKFHLIFHDMDTILGMGDASVITLADIQPAGTGNTIYDCTEAGKGGDIFDKLIPLFNQPTVLTQYHQYLQELLKGTFSKTQFDALVNRSFANGGWAASDIATVKTTITQFMDGDGGSNPIGRRQGILNKIIPALAVTSGPAVVSGYPQTATSVIPALSGTFDSTNANQVLLNGSPATIDLKQGTWSNAAVAETLVAIGTAWKYYDLDAAPLSTWAASSFVDTSWLAGPSPLGYSPQNEDAAATVIGGGTTTGAGTGTSSHFTSYFRKHITITTPGKYTGNVTIRCQRDDGLVLYLNGTEIGRDNLPTGPITNTTPASASLTPEDSWVTFTFPATSLLTGDNVIAAEIHQTALSSSDCRFNCEMTANASGGNLGALTALNPGINRVTIEEKNAAGEHVRYTFYDIWYNVAETSKSGAIAAGTTTWTAAGGPYRVSAEVTVGAGATLVIEPGATVYMGPAFSITVSGTGRLVAEGTQYNHIRFTQKPGTTEAYAALDFLAAPNESRLVWCDIEKGAGKTVSGHQATIHCNTGSKILIDHCQFFNSDSEYFSEDASSFMISNSWFQTYTPSTSRPEMLHGVGGVATGGYGIIQGNVFGHTFGFNDIFDLTDANRTSSPGATHTLFQAIDNIFMGATDDCLDLDSTDSWVEGNIFMHVHEDANRTTLADTGSGVSGGVDYSPQPSQWAIINNIFYDVDHATLGKGGVRYSFINNTVYHVGLFGGVAEPQNLGVLNMTDDGVAIPVIDKHADLAVENNIMWDTPRLVANYAAVTAIVPNPQVVTFNNNILDQAWTGPGSGNQVVTNPGLRTDLIDQTDPLWTYGLSNDPAFLDYETIWRKVHAAFTVCPGSAAYKTGPGGVNKGGNNQRGVTLTGVPAATTTATSASISVGPYGNLSAGTGTYVTSIPAFPYGFVAYKYSLDGGAYTAETPIATPITLTGLAAGSHTIQVLGKNNSASGANPAGVNLSWETAPIVRTWTVDPAYLAPVLINEVLATNVATLANGLAHPDVIELYNPRALAVDISGYAISDDPLLPAKYIFPATTSIPAGGYLVLYADIADGNPGTHLGFSLDGDGETVVLSSPNGALWNTMDSVTFGLQLTDKSIGRVGLDRHWDLNVPSIGAVNVQQPNDCPGHIVLNEWLANSTVSYKDDQIELYNTNALPGNIGGYYLSDSPDNPLQYQFPPLSFVDGKGFAVIQADGLTLAQANHVPFKLDAFYDWLVLSDAAGVQVDRVALTCAQPDVTEGRSPDGSSTITTLALPTFGLPNGTTVAGGTTVKTYALIALNATWRFYDQFGSAANTGAPVVDPAWKTLAFLPPTRTTTTSPVAPLNSWGSGGAPLALDPTYPAGLPAIVTPLIHGASTETVDYFRTLFSYAPDAVPSGATATTVLKLTHIVDDGAAFYLNGTDVTASGTTFRYNLPATALAASTVATASLEASQIGPVTLDAGSLTAGTNTNVLAVEVHQSAVSSSDVVFALKLDAEVTTITPSAVDPVYQRMLDLMAFLRITEVHYAPLNGSNFEFVEVQNTSTTKTLDITGVRFTAGITYTFSTLSLLPGQYALVAKTPSAYSSVPRVVGPFVGKLDNAGEQLAMTLPLPYTANIECFTYQSNWFPGAFGAGSSLEIIDPLTSRFLLEDKLSWKASVNSGGSPGGLTQVFNFATWVTALSTTGANTDPDKDGIDNLLEYALTIDPKTADAEKAQVEATFDLPQTHLLGILSMPVVCPTDIRYLVQVGDQLTGWTTVATKVGTGAWTGSATVNTSAPSSGRVTVIVTDPDFVSAHPRSFLRMRTELIP